jgi:hypothetical protein
MRQCARDPMMSLQIIVFKIGYQKNREVIRIFKQKGRGYQNRGRGCQNKVGGCQNFRQKRGRLSELFFPLFFSFLLYSLYITIREREREREKKRKEVEKRSKLFKAEKKEIHGNSFDTFSDTHHLAHRLRFRVSNCFYHHVWSQ